MRKCEVIIGDCLTELKKMKDNSIDCVITSPPYNLGGDFHTFSKGKRVSYGGYATKKDKIDEKEYQENQINVLNALYRITKENSFCFYVHKDRIVKNEIISPLYWISKTKWKISQIVVLDQRSTANVDKRRFFPTHEYLFVLCKNKDSKLHNDRCATSVWKVRKIPRKISGHPATFDYDIPYECILAATKENETVMDCYAGSFTTAIAALQTDRAFVGIEISKEYVSKAINKDFIEEYKAFADITIKETETAE